MVENGCVLGLVYFPNSTCNAIWGYMSLRSPCVEKNLLPVYVSLFGPLILEFNEGHRCESSGLSILT